MSASPTWYDLLGVDCDASTEEVRATWKAAIVDLEPDDRRFDTLNRAAKVLLDPATRLEYDAALAADAVEPEPVAEPGVDPDVEPGVDPDVEPGVGPGVGPGASTELVAERPAGHDLRRRAPLLVAAAVVVAAVLAAGVWLVVPAGANAEDSAREAQAAAERAVVPVLSYDHATLAEDQEAAQALMTGSYRKDYDQLFEVIKDNAPRTKTVVDAEVVASGIVRSGEDRVQVLVFVDRPTTNKQTRTPVVYKDQVTLTMQKVDDSWLVDDMVTSPVQG